MKVPSCAEHNSKKSKDDEILRWVLASAPGTNALALHVVEEGVLPSIERRPHLLNTFMPNFGLVQAPSFETGKFTVDLVRLERSVASIVRALFFRTQGRKLHEDLTVIWSALLSSDLKEAPFLPLIQKWEAILPANYVGENPTVFRYSFHTFANDHSWLCRMQFYEGHPIYASWHESADEGGPIKHPGGMTGN